LFILALAGSVSIHAGTNLVNDYFDHVKGADNAESLGQERRYPTWAAQPAGSSGGRHWGVRHRCRNRFWITVLTGWPVLALGLASVAAGYFYTASPFSLAYRGLGEVVVFVFMGPVIVLGAYFVQTQSWAWAPFVASSADRAAVAAILQANNVRDIDNDRKHGKWTLAALARQADSGLRILRADARGYAVVVAMTAFGTARGPCSLHLSHCRSQSASCAFESLQRSPPWTQSRTRPDRRTAHALRGTAGARLRLAVWTGMA